ncbi:aromatic-ring hydroxylase C-terminal domain-containing protein [Streptomyces sp. NPDC002520]
MSGNAGQVGGNVPPDLARALRPGGRQFAVDQLPHAWRIDTAGHRLPALDLAGCEGFSVVTGFAGAAWAEAAAVCAAEFGIPPSVVRIDEDGARDVCGSWQWVNDGLDERGCLLVRPDCVMAWRHPVPVDGSRTDDRRTARQPTAVLHR